MLILVRKVRKWTYTQIIHKLSTMMCITFFTEKIPDLLDLQGLSAYN